MARDATQLVARVSLRGARAAFVGPPLNLGPHRSAVAVLAVALEEPFELAWTGAGDDARYRSHEAVLVPPGQHHHVRPYGPMGFLYLDALGDDHAALRRIDPRRHAEAIRQAVTALWSVDDLCRALGLPPKPTPDARVAALLRVMDETPNAFARVQDAARFMGVSASRCRELLRSVAGVPFSRYRLWRRFALVVGEHCNARSLTEAAHRAGFASSAHLSVAFRRMFGLAPSALLRPGVSFDVA